MIKISMKQIVHVFETEQNWDPRQKTDQTIVNDIYSCRLITDTDHETWLIIMINYLYSCRPKY